jgi:hypothetical protein
MRFSAWSDMVEVGNHPGINGLFGRWVSESARPVNGFKWMSGEGWYYDDIQLRWEYEPVQDGPWLVAVDGPDAAFEHVEVLNDPRRAADPQSGLPGFHRIFAKLADGREATRQKRILDFANRYGFLGDEPKLLYQKPGDRGDESYISAQGESLNRWEAAIYEAATVVAIWDRVCMNDATTLGKLVDWYPRPRASIDCMYRNGRLFRSVDFSRHGDNDEWCRGAGAIVQEIELEECDGPPIRWTGDPVEVARQCVYNYVMFRLRGEVAPILDRQSDPELWFAPRTLLAAVYLHLAREISGRHRLAIPCANQRCGAYFVPERGTKQYCSQRCRQQAAYYRNKAV